MAGKKNMDIKNLTLETELITIRGKTLRLFRPAKLEEVFQGDPFLETEKFPLWLKLWEASIVLTDYLGSLPPGKEILELGAGLGVISLFASAFGHRVLATDKEELPLKLLEKSAKENGLSLNIQKLDWLAPEISKKFDLVVGAEIIFKKSHFEPLINLFKSSLKPEGEVLLAHSAERKRILIPFLHRAQEFFEIQTSIRKLRSQEETQEVILNKLLPKREG
ncbi:class I SAM-dependent methyltransferase [Caldimicrobium thiodismutans]|jgi:2-polyprenyl-3-methyl-5-hydroxy-6-metoxy-1,4-benzoquinol methylase|nr:methyltransferase domain-containing protein [Caldimicrobium thiodismutans]